MSDRDNHENAASRSREAAVYERGWADAIRAATNAIRRIPAANGGQSDMRGAAAVVVEALRPPAPSETEAPCPVLGMRTDADIAGHSVWSANEGSTADQWRARCSCDWHTDITTEADADRAVQAHLEQYVYGPARVATERACPRCGSTDFRCAEHEFCAKCTADDETRPSVHPYATERAAPSQFTGGVRESSLDEGVRPLERAATCKACNGKKVVSDGWDFNDCRGCGGTGRAWGGAK